MQLHHMIRPQFLNNGVAKSDARERDEGAEDGMYRDTFRLSVESQPGASDCSRQAHAFILVCAVI